MYRPTVRYAQPFREYVDNLFQVTHLDRNQIFRLALYELGKSDILKQYLKDPSAPLPKSLHTTFTPAVWLENTIELLEGGTSLEEKGGGTSHVKEERLHGPKREIPRHQGPLHEKTHFQGPIIFGTGNTLILKG